MNANWDLELFDIFHCADIGPKLFAGLVSVTRE